LLLRSYSWSMCDSKYYLFAIHTVLESSKPHMNFNKSYK